MDSNMSGNVQRICVQCGASGPLEARYCARCGYDSQGQLPAPPQNLSLAIGKAAMPVMLGVASLALRMGWKLLQSRWTKETARATAATVLNQIQPASSQPLQPSVQAEVAPARRRRTIHIRSSWAVGDANGVWRQGHTEHHIELGE
jgi:hypothetical protein